MTRRAHTPSKPPRRRRRARPARALLALWLALVVAVPAALGGARFAWCIPMARAQLHCCCHGAPHAAAPSAHDAPAPSADAPRVRVTCCEGRDIASMPASPSAHATEVPVLPAPLVAHLTRAELFAPSASPVAEHALEHARLPRAGPEPPLFALHRVYLC